MIIVAYFVVFSGICLVVTFYRNHNKERSINLLYLKTHSDQIRAPYLFSHAT